MSAAEMSAPRLIRVTTKRAGLYVQNAAVPTV